MNGIFGGVLGIIDSIGGAFLYILIGSTASKASAAARLSRLFFGALIIGFAASIALYVLWPERAFQNMIYQDNAYISGNTLPLVYIPPVAALGLTGVLELLRASIEGRFKV